MNPSRSFRTRGDAARSAPVCFPACAAAASSREERCGLRDPRGAGQSRADLPGPHAGSGAAARRHSSARAGGAGAAGWTEGAAAPPGFRRRAPEVRAGAMAAR